MPLPSASIVFGWPICDNRQKKWKIRTILAINNCSMRQQALIDTREIWRSRKLCKSSSRWIQMQLLVLEAFLNFPKCFITWPTHTWIMTQLFFCKKRHQRAKLGVAAPSRYWKIYYLCYELNQNTESTLKHDSIEKMFKRKTKNFLPFVFIGKNIKARMLMMFRTTRSIAMRSWRPFIQTSTPKVTT